MDQEQSAVIEYLQDENRVLSELLRNKRRRLPFWVEPWARRVENAQRFGQMQSWDQ